LLVYHEHTHQVQALTDEEAATLLNRDALIRQAWQKWNAASKNHGSLIVLDAQRVLRVLRTPTDGYKEDDDTRGLA
jgi:hypothetical protein